MLVSQSKLINCTGNKVRGTKVQHNSVSSGFVKTSQTSIESDFCWLYLNFLPRCFGLNGGGDVVADQGRGGGDMLLELYRVIRDRKWSNVQAGFFFYDWKLFCELHIDTECIVESIS